MLLLLATIVFATLAILTAMGIGRMFVRNQLGMGFSEPLYQFSA